MKEACESGILAGYPLIDVKATLVDGSYHDVDSNEMAFKIAGSMAMKNAVTKASPVLLEPMMKVEVEVPEDFMGNVIGDLNSRRGQIEGQETEDGLTKVTPKFRWHPCLVMPRIFARRPKVVASFRWSSATMRKFPVVLLKRSSPKAKGTHNTE